MERCLELAANGLGKVSPNPLVGAVLVHDGRIIGEGYHRQYGQAHAEVNAIDDCKKNGLESLLPQSTLYVNLEPCNHYGKTPPCTDLILQNKIPEVVIGMKDPFSKVNGEGTERLRKACIQVTENVMRQACEELNRRFITFQTLKRPYLILKYAQSRDGFISPAHNEGKIHWISNNYSRMLVHKWRAEEDAVLVGFNTVLKDNPLLTVRSWAGRNPVRIAIDYNLTLDKSSHLFNDEARTILFNYLEDGVSGNLEYVKILPGESMPQQVCLALFDRSIQSVMIEGGLRLMQGFVNEELWDEARIFTAPHNLVDGIPAPFVSGALVSKENIHDDELSILRNISRKLPE